MITHRPNTLGAVDKVLFLRDGMPFGPRHEIIAKLTRTAPIQVVSTTAGGAR